MTPASNQENYPAVPSCY